MKKNRVKGLLALGLSLTMMISTAGCGKEQQLNAEINPDTPVSEVQFIRVWIMELTVMQCRHCLLQMEEEL